MNCPHCDAEVVLGMDSCPSCGEDLTEQSLPQPLRGRLHELILEDPLSQLNAPKPLSVPVGDSVAHAVDLMKKHRFGSVLVVDDGGGLVGIFTERDLLLKIVDPSESLDSVTIESVMTASPKTLREDDTIAHALNRMAVGGYRHIPILREGKPVGFVSIRGILRYISMNAL